MKKKDLMASGGGKVNYFFLLMKKLPFTDPALKLKNQLESAKYQVRYKYMKERARERER